ncbi:MAG: long-chain fatty acid--CoA ligase [Actinomycetota bacterium]|nr:long-chain fatty acid--CoA ligase [Actinomycetota bacterium]
MKSTMQTTPLLISNLLRFGTTVHADSTVTTWKADGPEITTYGEVGKISARLANALRGMGITGDQRVGTFMWNNTEHLAAYLAVPSMGAVLHAINIRLFPEQLIYTAQHGGSEVVIVDDSLAEPFSQVLPHLTNVRHVIINGTDVSDEVCASMAALDHIESVRQWDELLAGQIDTFDWPEDLDENCASSMCYTSGTTGNPKGVVYSHRSNYLHATGVTAALGIGQAEKFLVVVPLFHANAWGYPYCAMTSGASLVMPGKYLQPEPLAQMIRDLKITTGAGVPTVWNALLQYLDANEEADVSTCRMLMIGGSAAPPSMMKAFQDRHSIEIIHGWGMTEMSPVGSLASPPGAVEYESKEYWDYRASQGRLLCGVEARVMGPDGQTQPWDNESVGEIEVRGPWITGSYYSNGTESESEIDDAAAKFDEGWLRTGDVGKLTHDGFLVLTDRSKDVIKSGGEWISSVDLENQIMGHPDVVEASVVGVPDEKWGERPLAAVVLRSGATTSADELREFLDGKVAKWQLPERWTVIDEVPKTSVGKFDKKVLRQRYADGELEVSTAG